MIERYLFISFFLGIIHFSSITMAQSCDSTLNPIFESYAPEFLEVREPKTSIPIECIAASMDTFYSWTTSLKQERAQRGASSIGHYVYCTADSSQQIIKKHQPPCKTNAYLLSTRNIYEDVLNCFEISPKEMLPIIAVESGFHINPVSLIEADIGIGQLTPMAIEDVGGLWNETLDEIKNNKNTSCQRILPLINDLPAVSENRNALCELTDAPINPARSLVYKIMLHRRNFQYIDQLFRENSILARLNTLSQFSWDEGNIKELEQILAVLAYNAGAQPAVEMLIRFLNDKDLSLKEIQNQMDNIQNEIVNLHLQAKDLEARGLTLDAQKKLNERLSKIEIAKQLSDKLIQSFFTATDFNITDDPKSFGSFLVKQQLSSYLQILKDRLTYLESTLNQPAGYCADPSFLNKIK